MNNIANLFSALVKAGVVSATPTPPGATVKSEAQPHDPLRDAIRDHRRAVMAQKVKLSSADIARYVE